MAGFTAIAGVGKSIERLIAAAFLARQPVPNNLAKVALIRAEDMKDSALALGLSILLYRVDFNKTMRASWSAVGQIDGRAHLALDLHFLLTPWADSAEHQHMILGRAMQALELTAMLAGPLLYEPSLPATEMYADEPQASSADNVQILLEEISTEALMRTFDSLPSDYRLSVPYIARVVRIDTPVQPVAPPVTDAQTQLRMTA